MKITKAGRKLLSLLLTAAMLVTAQVFPASAENAADPAEASAAELTVDSAGAAAPSNPVHHCTKEDDGTDTTDWNYVYFGSYPQTEVSGDALTSAVTGAAYDANGDAWVNGTRYRRISESDTNDSDFFGDSAYRYFKWERIKWRVLQNDGSTLFVAADKGLDCKYYNEENISITWENCTLRNWLNSNFYGTAFSSEEQQAIVSQTVVNEDNPYDNTEGGNDTSDKLYLLSIGEVTDPAYGFCEAYGTCSASRWMQASDYAHARGAYTYSGIDTGGNAICWWWLRSPGLDTNYAAGVDIEGYVARDGDSVNHPYDAVVPALHINLSSDLWFSVDDGADIGTGSDTQNPSVDNGNGGTGGSGADIGTGTDTQGNPGGSQDTSGGSGVLPNQDASDSRKTAVNKISISVLSTKIAAGKKVSLTATVFPQNASDTRVTWTSSNKKYAAVNSKGVVTTKKAGEGRTVTITATAADGSGVKAAIKLKLMKNVVTKVSLSAPNKTLKAGKSMQLKAAVKTNGKNANKVLKWTSSNPKYAAVNSKGKVTAKKAGKGKTVTITAASTDGTNKKAKVKLKIK